MSFRQRIDGSAPSRFLIVQTGSTLAELRARRGDFPDWFQRGLGVERRDLDVVRVDSGGVLPADAHAYARIVVTGSPAMVSERLLWSEETAAWLRDMIDAHVPVLGVCYGHQLLAHALGGRVDYHPSGRELGTILIERLSEAADDALLHRSPPAFLAHSSHRQTVLELPQGAVALARSAHDPHHAVRYAPAAWGFQFHPEFSVEIMRGYVQRAQQSAANDCLHVASDHHAEAPAPVARRLLRNFRDFARRSLRDLNTWTQS